MRKKRVLQVGLNHTWKNKVLKHEESEKQTFEISVLVKKSQRYFFPKKWVLPLERKNTFVVTFKRCAKKSASSWSELSLKKSLSCIRISEELASEISIWGKKLKIVCVFFFQKMYAPALGSNIFLLLPKDTQREAF